MNNIILRNVKKIMVGGYLPEVFEEVVNNIPYSFQIIIWYRASSRFDTAIRCGHT